MISKILEKTYIKVNNIQKTEIRNKRKFKKERKEKKKPETKKKKEKNKKKSDKEKVINVDISNNKKVVLDDKNNKEKKNKTDNENKEKNKADNENKEQNKIDNENKEQNKADEGNKEQNKPHGENKQQNKTDNENKEQNKADGENKEQIICDIKINKSSLMKCVFNLIIPIFTGKMNERKLKNNFDIFIVINKVDPNISNKRICKTPFKKWYIKGYSHKSDLRKIVNFILGFTNKINDNLKSKSNFIKIIKINYLNN
jgi:hypothetical protein